MTDLDDKIKAEMRAVIRIIKEKAACDEPKITVLERGPGSLIKIKVEFTDEQIERFRKRPVLGFQIPFD